MIINLSDLLTIVLFVSLIILIIIFIVLGIKLIKTLKKVDEIIDDVNGKMEKVNGVFDIIDKTTDYAATIGDKIIEFLSKTVNYLFLRKKGKDDNE